jgi:hypothetical protein
VGCQKPLMALTSRYGVARDYDQSSPAAFALWRWVVVWSLVYLALRHSLDLDFAPLSLRPTPDRAGQGGTGGDTKGTAEDTGGSFVHVIGDGRG